MLTTSLSLFTGTRQQAKRAGNERNATESRRQSALHSVTQTIQLRTLCVTVNGLVSGVFALVLNSCLNQSLLLLSGYRRFLEVEWPQTAVDHQTASSVYVQE